MALTEQEYYDKLRSLVPEWFFEEEEYNDAVFRGLAAVLAKIHVQADEHVKQTFIKWQNAEGLFLDAHGEERNLDRLASEPDPTFSERIRNITNLSDRPAIKTLVDALLINGESTVIDGYETHFYFDREAFLNRGEIWSEIFYNVFTILVENQLHDPYSFFDRENFMSREDFLGSTESNLAIFEQIVAAVDKAKAFGVLYRLLERVAA